ncbi:MAG: AI-2E family transporter [Actinomycetota bacterium]|nr:AI-2E family transporter [Actinomycetota bacterium]
MSSRTDPPVAEAEAAAPASSRPPAGGEAMPRPLTARPTVRVGVYAWAAVGIAALAYLVGQATAEVSVLVIPLLLALFPAAVLAPPTGALKSRGMPPAAAALGVLVGSLLLLAAAVALLAPAVAEELPQIRRQLISGYEQATRYLEAGPFGFEPIEMSEITGRIHEQLLQAEGLVSGVFGAAAAVAEGFAGLVFGLVALFFYLKDGEKMAAWARDLFPEGVRADVDRIGTGSWHTLGAYFRGQVLVALSDAVLIGLGLLLLRVPLVLPLAVVVFVGGLFPIIGAVVAGSVAILVGLATGGLLTALAVLALVIGVQQLEGHVLAPVLLGRATHLHPLAVLVSLTAGAILLGVLGAFIAVPVAASIARSVGYLRERIAG